MEPYFVKSIIGNGQVDGEIFYVYNNFKAREFLEGGRYGRDMYKGNNYIVVYIGQFAADVGKARPENR